MKLAPGSALRGRTSRRGVALLMAFLVLMVVLAICAQLRVSTGASQRTSSNDLGLPRRDQAIESSLLEMFDMLKQDSESAADSGGAAGGAGGAAGAAGAAGATGGGVPGAAGGAGGGQDEPSDSHEDTWGKPQRTAINQVELRVIVQDEDSKVNVLGLLTPDETEAEKVFVRVVRILDTCRQGTTEDIDSGDAERMAIVMRDHLRKRSNSVAPRAKLLSDTEEEPDTGLPLTLKEFASLEPFRPEHFRDYRDGRGKIVHSIGAFLTVHTTLRTGDSLLPATSSVSNARGAAPAAGAGANSGAGANPGGGATSGGAGASTGAGTGGSPSTGTGGASTGGGQSPSTGQGGQAGGGGSGSAASGSASGIAVNVNTAPPCVLKALVDDRDVSGRWWDAVIEYRNLEEKKEDDEAAEEAEPVYDEYGREVIQRQVFDALSELEQVPGTERLGGDAKAEALRLLTTQSQVFSIYVTARILNQGDTGRTYEGPPRPGERDDELGNSLTRTVRAVVWRVSGDEGTTIVPLIRWEVLDYIPFEVLDYPDEDR
ncbi:MAG: hypothetical protein IPK67_05230 [Planctomycetes bacterium]|nr:hypothetical protein [Planctomycetota bacterium]